MASFLRIIKPHLNNCPTGNSPKMPLEPLQPTGKYTFQKMYKQIFHRQSVSCKEAQVSMAVLLQLYQNMVHRFREIQSPTFLTTFPVCFHSPVFPKITEGCWTIV